MEDEALLQAIIENPEDDTLKLAFADWLDENPKPDVPCKSCAASGWMLLNPGPDGRWVPCSRCEGREFVPDKSNHDLAELIRLDDERHRRWPDFAQVCDEDRPKRYPDDADLKSHEARLLKVGFRVLRHDRRRAIPCLRRVRQVEAIGDIQH